MNHIKIIFVDNNIIFCFSNDNKIYKEIFDESQIESTLLKYFNLLYKEKDDKVSKSFIKSLIKMRFIENAVLFVNQNKSWYRQKNITEYNKIKSLYLETYDNSILLKDILNKRIQDNNFLLKELEINVNKNPNDDYALFKYGLALANFNNYDDAIDNIREAISINSNNPEYFYQLALIYQKCKKYELAISEIVSALEIDLENYKYIKTLAELYFEINKYKESLDMYNELLTDPKIPLEDIFELQIRVGLIYNKLGFFDDSILLFSEILELEPNNIEAKIAYEEAIELKKRLTSADLNNLGIAYAEKNKYDKAIEKFKKAIEINPSDPEFYFNLGMAYKKNDMLIQASLEFKNALKINESLYDIYLELAEIYEKQNNNNLAIEEYKKYIEKSNDLNKIKDIKKLLESLITK